MIKPITKWIIAIIMVAVFCTLAIIFSVIVQRSHYPNTYSDEIEKYSAEYAVQKELVQAIILCESEYNSKAVSKKGAIGLMQLMPQTASWIASMLGEQYDEQNLYEPSINIRYGTYYLAYLSTKFTSEIEIISAYNAGETVTAKWKQNGELIVDAIPYSETRLYVKKVLKAKGEYEKMTAN